MHVLLVSASAFICLCLLYIYACIRIDWTGKVPCKKILTRKGCWRVYSTYFWYRAYQKKFTDKFKASVIYYIMTE